MSGINGVAPVAKALRGAGDLYGSYRFYGEWLGRPYDNCYRVTAIEVVHDCLVIRSDEPDDVKRENGQVVVAGGGTLRIWNPEDLRIEGRYFEIMRASRVQWQQYYYGRPRLPENLESLDYICRPAGLEVTSTGMRNSKRRAPVPDMPAVLMDY